MNVLLYIIKLPYRLILLAYNGLILLFYYLGFVFRMFNQMAEQKDNTKHGKEINWALEFDELFNEEYGKCAQYKKQYYQILIALGFVPNNAEFRYREAKKNEQKNEEMRKNEPLKNQGDLYETYIGKKFEKKGYLVVYNGKIHGRYDKGVDLVCFSMENKTVNIIQCKNWLYRDFNVENVEDIYKKLDIFERYHLYFSLKKVESINFYLKTPWITRDILKIEFQLKEFKVYKTLYLSHYNVVQPELSHQIEKIKSNIFRYRNMKIVIAPMI